jgi:hypothetical protein
MLLVLNQPSPTIVAHMHAPHEAPCPVVAMRRSILIFQQERYVNLAFKQGLCDAVRDSADDDDDGAAQRSAVAAFDPNIHPGEKGAVLDRELFREACGLGMWIAASFQTEEMKRSGQFATASSIARSSMNLKLSPR